MFFYFSSLQQVQDFLPSLPSSLALAYYLEVGFNGYCLPYVKYR